MVTAAVAIVLAVGFDLTAIASIGSAVALRRVRPRHRRPPAGPGRDRGAHLSLLVLAIATTVVVLVAFAVTTLVEEPGTAVALVAILVLSIVLDLVWKRARDRAPAADGVPR